MRKNKDWRAGSVERDDPDTLPPTGRSISTIKKLIRLSEKYNEKQNKYRITDVSEYIDGTFDVTINNKTKDRSKDAFGGKRIGFYEWLTAPHIGMLRVFKIPFAFLISDKKLYTLKSIDEICEYILKEYDNANK